MYEVFYLLRCDAMKSYKKVTVFRRNMLSPSSGCSYTIIIHVYELFMKTSYVRSGPLLFPTVHSDSILTLIHIGVPVLDCFPDINSSDKLRLSGHCACEWDWPIQQECPTSCRLPAALRPSTVRFDVASEGLGTLHWARKWKRYSLVSMLTYIYANGWSAKGRWLTVNEQIYHIYILSNHTPHLPPTR